MTISWVHAGDAVSGEIAGRSVILRYTEPSVEYAALRSGAVVTDRSHRGRTRLEGPRAAELLTGLVTNDVLALAAGHGQYAAALSAKGKIVADVRIFAEDGSLLVDVPPRAAASWWEMLRKFVNPRLARYRDESSALRALGIFGARARRVVAGVTGLSADRLGDLAPHHHVRTEIDGGAALVARSPVLGLDGWEIFLPAEHFATLWSRALGAGATPMGLEAWEVARIEAGTPEWGIDIDDSTIPQEANFDELHAISYTKGCYVGQEVVARVHFRGHVNRHLRGLRFVSDTAPPAGAQLVDTDGKVVGDVRSAAISPRLGGVALGMVRREIEMGTTLRAGWEGGQAQADVAAIPFALE